MKPHFERIKHTMLRKQKANEAGNKQTAYNKYKDKVAVAQEHGYTRERIILELEEQADLIRADQRMGDGIFLQGKANAQNACIKAIEMIITELKGDK